MSKINNPSTHRDGRFVIYNITELNVIGFIVRCLTKKPPYVLSIEALMPPLGRLLNLIVDRLVKAGRAKGVKELCPELNWLHDYSTRTLLYNVFENTEDWHNRYFGYDRVDLTVPVYGLAYKQLTCNYVKAKHFATLSLNKIFEYMDPSKIKLVGLSPDIIEMYDALWQEKLRCGRPNVLLMIVINFIQYVGVQLYSVLWVLIHCRVYTRNKKEIFFCADFIGDERDLILYRESSKLGSVLLVVRDQHQKHLSKPEFGEFLSCESKDGLIGPGLAIGMLVWIVADGAKLFRHFIFRHPSHFYQIITLPFRKAVLRAFFNRYMVANYWGRDDYNVEHILRREELHRIGGRSLGIGHGYPSYAYIFPMWRYINFDYYFVFNRLIYERAMKPTWPVDMEVISVGSFETVDDESTARQSSPPNDIVVYTAAYVGLNAMTVFVRTLAESFPDRIIHLQIKGTFIDTDFGKTFAADCTRDINNIEVSSGSFLELARKSRYSFSDPSTILVESLQIGQMVFFADVFPDQQKCIYRDFPQICVINGSEAVEKIRSIEAGTDTYDFAGLSELLPPGDHSWFDRVTSYFKLDEMQKSG